MAWPRRFRTFWCVIDERGTAYLVSSRVNRSKSIIAFLNDVDTKRGDWRWWKRNGYSCQRLDIKVRSSGSNGTKP
jgi:hypothetical protein